MPDDPTYPADTQWLTCVRVDHGKHFTVENRYVAAATRKEAITKALNALKPNEGLNGVSLIPAKEYQALNATSK